MITIRTFSSIARAVAAVALALLLAPAAQAAQKAVVAVVKSRDLPQYATTLTGFEKALKKKGISPSLVVFDMAGSKESALRIAGDVRAAKPDLVFTIGSLATETARDELREIPSVFGMVLNPVASGLVRSMDTPGGGMTGASMDIPVRQQFAALKSVTPGAKRIGVLYNPKESSAVIGEAEAAARDMGLTLVARSVGAESDVPGTLDDLTKDIDCLWAVSDGTVFSSLKSIQYIILTTLRSNVAFMGLSPAFVKSGALLALSCDIEDNGAQAGELAARILHGEKPGEIPVSVPRKTYISLNLRIAAQIGVTVPPETVAAAREVFK